MRKIQKAALVAAMLGSLGLIGAGTAAASTSGSGSGHDGKKDKNSSIKITQSSECKSHDVNLALLNNVGIANGVLGNLLGGEGNPGAQYFDQGSTQDCSNEVG